MGDWELKLNTAFQADVRSGRKKAEIRVFDKPYRAGDVLVLEGCGRYRITHVLSLSIVPGLQDCFRPDAPKWAMLSIEPEEVKPTVDERKASLTKLANEAWLGGLTCMDELSAMLNDAEKAVLKVVNQGIDVSSDREPVITLIESGLIRIKDGVKQAISLPDGEKDVEDVEDVENAQNERETASKGKKAKQLKPNKGAENVKLGKERRNNIPRASSKTADSNRGETMSRLRSGLSR